MHTEEEVFNCSNLCAIGTKVDDSPLVLQNDWENLDNRSVQDLWN